MSQKERTASKQRRRRSAPVTPPSAALPVYPDVGFYTCSDDHPTRVEAHEAEYARIARVLAGLVVVDTGRHHDWRRSPYGILVIRGLSGHVEARLRAAGYDTGRA